MKKIKLDELPQNLTLRELVQVAHVFGYELSAEVSGAPEVGVKPLPKPSVPCQGMTLQGFRCKNKPCKGSAFCHAHRFLEE